MEQKREIYEKEKRSLVEKNESIKKKLGEALDEAQKAQNELNKKEALSEQEVSEAFNRFRCNSCRKRSMRSSLRPMQSK